MRDPLQQERDRILSASNVAYLRGELTKEQWQKQTERIRAIYDEAALLSASNVAYLRGELTKEQWQKQTERIRAIYDEAALLKGGKP